ncbi:superoxide dismutase [candidate division BRC1 bacterium SM23_51]|nr:MAG: superoxide dismutase [candidate division BRC1 bacterium SM23_51]
MAAETSGGSTVEYTLPPLPYAVDALEPHLDARTLTIHHDKHHAGYVRGLNATLAKLEEARAKSDFGQVQALSGALAFHGSGHVLHTLYFANLHPKPNPPRGELLTAIKTQFGSVDALVAHLSAATAQVAGSGWGMLAFEPVGKRLVVLQIEKHENQMLCGAVPLLLIDVWEHAYYLQYQNRRSDYIKAITNVIHWDEVSRRFAQAQ